MNSKAQIKSASKGKLDGFLDNELVIGVGQTKSVRLIDPDGLKAVQKEFKGTPAGIATARLGKNADLWPGEKGEAVFIDVKGVAVGSTELTGDSKDDKGKRAPVSFNCYVFKERVVKVNLFLVHNEPTNQPAQTTPSEWTKLLTTANEIIYPQTVISLSKGKVFNDIKSGTLNFATQPKNSTKHAILSSVYKFLKGKVESTNTIGSINVFLVRSWKSPGEKLGYAWRQGSIRVCLIPETRDQAKLDQAQLAHIIAHEIGHLFGLEHRNQKGAMMYYSDDPYIAGSEIKFFEAETAHAEINQYALS